MLSLVLLTIAAAALRIPLLSRPMGADESATFLYYASHPLPIALTVYGSPNNHILHTVLMHASWRVFGNAEWALRLPAFIAGVALVPLTYFASRALAERGALLATMLSASAPVLIDYSTDARGYTMLCCFTLICAIAIARQMDALFALSAALGFYTIPVMLYPFLMLIIWGRKRVLVPALVAVVVTIFFYLPVLLVSGLSSLTTNPYVRPLSIGEFVRGALPYLNTVREHLFVGVPIVVQLLIAIGFIFGVRWHSKVWIGFGVVIFVIALQRVLPFPRIWLPFLPLLFITAAASWPWKRSEPGVAIALLLTLAMTGMTIPRLRETGELRAVREMARELKLRANRGDAVLALPPSEMPLAFYCPQVEVLHPDLRRARFFVVENRDYGQTFPRTLTFFRIDPRQFAIRRIRDFGSSALYELRR